MSFFSRRNNPPQPEDEPDSTASQDDTNASVVDVDVTIEETDDDSASEDTRVFDTALGAGSSLEGHLSSDGNVRLDGKFKGTLDITENILVGVTANIEADVGAKNVSIAGTVRGNVSGDKVHLLSTARVWGDIQAKSLITEDGAFIEGRVSMNALEGKPSLPVVVEDDESTP